MKLEACPSSAADRVAAVATGVHEDVDTALVVADDDDPVFAHEV
jgi:hypothetical protein